MTRDGTRTCEWDAEGLMMSVDGGSTVTYKATRSHMACATG
ncbi:MAG TPA: hypothetical protein VFQ24_12445 [Terriglobia bacterium]|nr:hypothetical protein [Terriglobia bacterium]